MALAILMDAAQPVLRLRGERPPFPIARKEVPGLGSAADDGASQSALDIRSTIMTSIRIPAGATPLLGSRGRAVAAAVGGLAITLAVLVVAVFPASEQNPDDLYADRWAYARDIGLLLFLLGTVAAVEVVRRRRLGPAVATRLVQVGYTLVAIGVVAGLILGSDPGWFFVLAGPGILASVVGYVWWAIETGRRRVFPVWAAVLLGVGGLTALALAEYGTTVFIGSFWLYLAARSTADGDGVGGVGVVGRR